MITTEGSKNRLSLLATFHYSSDLHLGELLKCWSPEFSASRTSGSMCCLAFATTSFYLDSSIESGDTSKALSTE